MLEPHLVLSTLKYFCVWGNYEHEEAISDIPFGAKMNEKSWDPEIPPSWMLLKRLVITSKLCIMELKRREEHAS